MRPRTTLTLLAASSILAACTPSPSTSSADAAPPTVSASASAAPLPPPATASAPPTAEPSTAPYRPPPEEPSEAPPAPAKRTKLGTFEDWVAAYEGLGAPEGHKPPPRLGLVKDLSIKAGRLVYARSGDLWRFDVATLSEARLTREAGRNYHPVFFAGGKKIAFLSNRGGGAYRVFAMNADGTGERPITGKIRGEYSRSFAITEDGARAAYVNDEPGDWPSHRLHLVDVASGADEAVGERDTFEDLRFSPDGKQLFLVAGGFDGQRVAVLDVAEKRLSRHAEAGAHMFQSPQRFGDRLLFSASPTASYCCRDSRLFTAALDGSDRKVLGPLELAGSMRVSASPGAAKRIAVDWSVREGGFGADWRSDITVVDDKGIPVRTLAEAFPRPFYSAGEPSWAPDGRHLAFTLSLCPYVGCELSMHSVVIVDVLDAKAPPAFVAYAHGAAWSPAP